MTKREESDWVKSTRRTLAMYEDSLARAKKEKARADRDVKLYAAQVTAAKLSLEQMIEHDAEEEAYRKSRAAKAKAEPIATESATTAAGAE